MGLLQNLFYEPVTAIFMGLVLLVVMWSTAVKAKWLPRCLLLVAPAVWFAYSLYEMYMVYVWERGVIAPIRLDLALLFPVMCALTALSLIVWMRLLWRGSQISKRASKSD